MAWHFEGRIAITVHGERAPSREDWATYIETISRLPNLATVRALVVSAGGGPNAIQRGELVDLFDSDDRGATRTAIVTRSMTMRGIATAISWFNRGLKAFKPSEMDAALVYLEFGSTERAIAKTTVVALQRGFRTTSNEAAR